MCMYSKGVARSRPNAPLLGSNTIMHSLAATIAKQSIPRSRIDDENAFCLFCLSSLTQNIKRLEVTRMKINNSHRDVEALSLNAK